MLAERFAEGTTLLHRIDSQAKTISVIINTFTIFLLVTLPLTFGGDQLKLLPWFEVSREGTRLALLIALKTNAVLIAMMLSTSTVAAIEHGLLHSCSKGFIHAHHHQHTET